MTQSKDDLQRRLGGIAAALELPGLGPRVEAAVALALELLVADLDTPATVTVASLGIGATLRDSGDAIREMLHEQGLYPPSPQPGAHVAYSTALWAVALDGISVGEFGVIFYNHIVPWDEQNPSQRELVVLLHEWDQASDAEARQPITTAIRNAAAQALRTL
jgi:hypothetical protein